nr:ATP-binding protein [uncultured Anaeromusa sp.]
MKFCWSPTSSIRTLIVSIIAAQIIVFAMLTSWLAYHCGMDAVQDNSQQIFSIINDEISKTITAYLEEPYRLEKVHKNIIRNGQIDFSNEQQRDTYFVSMLKDFPKVTNTYFSMVDGMEYGARKEDNGSVVVWNSNLEKKTLDYYTYKEEIGRMNYIESLPDYDTRQRPPFKKGAELKKPGWTAVYASATGRGLVVTSVYPIYSSEHLVGVLGSSLLLNWIDDFLKELRITERSSVYVVERTGRVIASTNDAIRQSKYWYEDLKEEDDPLFYQCKASIRINGFFLENIHESQSFKFYYNGESFLLQVHAIEGVNGLNWLSFIVIPERDLMYQMAAFSDKLLVITLIACLLGSVIGFFTAEYIVRPLRKVNQRTREIANGDFSSRIKIVRNDEVGELAYTINEMSESLEQYVRRLNDERLRIKLLTSGLENSNSFVLILNEQRNIWWGNKAYEALSDYKISELLGKRGLMLLAEDNPSVLIEEIRQYLTSEKEWHGEVLAKRKDGRSYVDEISIIPIRDDASEKMHYIIVGQDITEKIKAREAIVEAQKAKVKAEQVHFVGTMASGIAHEINQPLNSIKVVSSGLLYLIQHGEQIEEKEVIDSLQEISNQVDRITSIIKHLRSFVKRGERKTAPCDMNEVVALAVDLLKEQLSSSAVRVEQNLQKNLPLVNANMTGLEEVVVNILVNAIQALETVEKAEKIICIETFQRDANVVLKISDNGPGIDAAIKETLFDSFTSTKQGGDNLGLGLAIVNNIIAAYLGTIEVASATEAGTTIMIALPAVEMKKLEEKQ